MNAEQIREEKNTSFLSMIIANIHENLFRIQWLLIFRPTKKPNSWGSVQFIIRYTDIVGSQLLKLIALRHCLPN
jgi:hypothetical protein